MNYIQNWVEAKKLPLGHYDRTKAAHLLDLEYRASSENERLLMKKFKLPSNIKSLQEAANLSGFVCKQLGVKPIKKIRISTIEVEIGVAHYNGEKKEIVCKPFSWCSVSIILHETAHHVIQVEKNMSGVHHKDFLWVEELLFEVAKSFFNKK